MSSASSSRPVVKRTYGRRNQARRQSATHDSDEEEDDTQSSAQDATEDRRDSKRLKGAAADDARPSGQANGSPSPSRSLTRSTSLRSTPTSSSQSISQRHKSSTESSVANGAGAPRLAVQPPSSQKGHSGPSTPRSLTRTKTETDLDVGSPRDLTPLFDSLSPARPGLSRASSSFAGRKRMLSKAQSMQAAAAATTVPSAPSTPRALRTTQSMPITPSTGHRSQGSAVSPVANLLGSSVPSSPSSERLSQPMAPDSPISGGRAKRTYGQTRSFLARTEIALDELDRESYSELRKRYEVDNDEDISGPPRQLAPDFLAQPPAPVTDMRSKGENRQFMDEVGFLIQGISGSNSTALRRTSATDLLRNMHDEGWLGKMRICGQTEPLFEALLARRADDDIFDTVCLLFLATLVHSGSGIEDVLRGDAEAVVRIAALNVGVRAGVLDEEYRGKLTPTVQLLRSFAKFGDSSASGTTRATAASIIASVTRERIWPAIMNIAAEHELCGKTLDSLVHDALVLVPRRELFMKGMPLIPKDSTIDLLHLERCLESLANITTQQCSVDERELFASRPEAVGVVVDIFVTMMTASDEEDEEIQSSAMRCAVHALRSLAPIAAHISTLALFPAMAKRPGYLASLGRAILSRDRLSSAHAPQSPSANGEEEGERSRLKNADDIFSSALTQLQAIITPSTGAQIATTPISACTLRACGNGCRCPSSRPFATVLADMYDDDASGSDENVMYNTYLAFIVGRLLVCAPEVRGLVEAHLPGEGWRGKVRHLTEILHELKTTDRMARRNLQVDVGEEDGALDLVCERLREMLEEL